MMSDQYQRRLINQCQKEWTDSPEKVCRVGGDRYIPTRNRTQMDVAGFLLSKTSSTSESQQAISLQLHGSNIADTKIINIGGKSSFPPNGFQNNTALPKKKRLVPLKPDEVLDVVDVVDDLALNLIDWSTENLLAMALYNTLYFWDHSRRRIIEGPAMSSEFHYVCSLAWFQNGNYLAVGTSNHTVQLLDIERRKQLRAMPGHLGRVTTLSWNEHIISSGSKSGEIHHYDVRVQKHHISTLARHSGEVCGLTWSPDGRYLASGGEDELMCLWPRVQEGKKCKPLHLWDEHQGPVKALAWCPWKSNILASGGKAKDSCIKMWNINNATCVTSQQTDSPISSLLFAPNYKELVSTHGYPDNNIVIWKYPSMTKVVKLEGHSNTILGSALNPDCTTMATLSADESLCIWKSFQPDALHEKARERRQISGAMHQTIR